MRAAPVIFGLAVVVAGVLCPPAVAAAIPSAPEGRRAPAVQIAPGVTYQKVVQTKPKRTYYVLTVDLASVATVDTAVAGQVFPSMNLTSKMVAQLGGVAGINGDFGLFPGRPGHGSAVDGELIQTSVLGNRGRAFAIRQDETAAYFGRPKFSIDLIDNTSGLQVPIDGWNEGPPKGDEVKAYSPRGGTLEPTPPDVCSARLIPTGTPRWTAGGSRIATPYVVDEISCGPTPMPRNGGVVVTARVASDAAATISLLGEGDSATIKWSPGWPGVSDVLGGGEILVRDGGVAVSRCYSYLCRKHPRTAVGVTAEGKILMVVVDGRSLFSGATLVSLAKLMVQLGAVDALNLDGSGSSTMVVNGKVVNKPSDGHERAVASALVVLPGPDSGDV